jgi:RHS repeat-associated protein
MHGIWVRGGSLGLEFLSFLRVLSASGREDGNLRGVVCGWDVGWVWLAFEGGCGILKGIPSMNAPTFFPKRLDSIGRRVSKQVWTRTDGAWVDESTTAFVYDGWNLISEISNLPSQIQSSKNYVWGIDLSGSLQGAGGVGGLLAQTHSDSSGTRTFHYLYDLNGNISEVLDGSGTIAAHYEYGPFGEVLREAYQSLEVRRSLGEGGFTFSTKYRDAETGLLYYGYRYHDSATGRWLNRDPIEESGGLNLYGFVGNDAVNGVDVLGQYSLGDAERSLENKNVQKLGAEKIFNYSIKVYSDEQIFEAWLVLERSDMDWLDDQPDCPCSTDCIDKKVWGELSDNLHGYHKTAKVCMRSNPRYGHANQCCYDSDGKNGVSGKLITHGSGSGSADRVPGTVKTFLGHKANDMSPADLADRLDGGVWGVWSEKYLTVRPSVGASKCSRYP